MTTAIVLGATGLVGSELVKILQASPFYSSVLLLNRRPSQHAHPKVVERIIDFDAPELDGITEGHLYCALGTTLKKAGSKEAQLRIDTRWLRKYRGIEASTVAASMVQMATSAPRGVRIVESDEIQQAAK